MKFRCVVLRLSLEELVRRRARRLLPDLVGLEPGDLLPEQIDALVEFTHRQQPKLLPDLMGDLFLWALVVLDRCHLRTSWIVSDYPRRRRLSHLPAPTMQAKPENRPRSRTRCRCLPA